MTGWFAVEFVGNYALLLVGIICAQLSTKQPWEENHRG